MAKYQAGLPLIASSSLDVDEFAHLRESLHGARMARSAIAGLSPFVLLGWLILLAIFDQVWTRSCWFSSEGSPFSPEPDSDSGS